MLKAQLITIGTEITSGEIVNANAAWVSLRLEEHGVRVFSHFTVRDQHDEIARALASALDCQLVVVTGGLGPTSDDITRESLARYFGVPLEFNETTWRELEQFYLKRGLPLREAHRHQCHFPRGAERLPNPAGTALGFAQKFAGRNFFVLPGPPSELAAMWNAEVVPRLRAILPPNAFHWVRWTCLGAPESEVAELVENVIAGSGLEVGYRASVPYVKVKLYVDEHKLEHRAKCEEVELKLAPFLVARGHEDLAEEFLQRWPEPTLHVTDEVTSNYLVTRLLGAQKALRELTVKSPAIEFSSAPSVSGLTVTAGGGNEEFRVSVRVVGGESSALQTLPYKVSRESERGKRSAAEWALWHGLKALGARPAPRPEPRARG